MLLQFDPSSYPFASRREVLFSRGGMVCTSQALAAQAGLSMLKKGGNAVDAALATAITLTVLEPTSNGIGSDLFAIIHMGGKVYGLNGSGFAPSAIHLPSPGSPIPLFGWHPVMVPGAPAAWAMLHKRFGSLPFKTLFTSAIEYAAEGYAVMPTLAQLLADEYKKYEPYRDNPAFFGLFSVFYKNGVPPVGSVLKLPELGRTLSLLAKTSCRSLYTGELADVVHTFSVKTGGFLRKKDLAAYCPEWVEPIRTTYKGYDVWELPPNGQGLVVLMALNILAGLPADTCNAETLHNQIEALKLAFTDGKRYIADRNFMKTSVAYWLSEKYAAVRRKQIGPTALEPMPTVDCGGTVYLCSADKDGNMVSLIQSNYDGFGSGVVIPDYGIALNNRGHNFSSDPGDDNFIGPRKRSYHTIIPGFLSKGGIPIGPFGVMGAFMQPQGHLQVLTNTIDFHLNPQAALDAPRWQWTGGKNIEVETAFPKDLIEKLRRRGHRITINSQTSSFGRGQIIWRNEEGILTGATDPRADGTVAAW